MGRTLCCDKSTGLKKGPWAAEEDQKLIDYIQEHGLGTWRSVPKKAGLARCGKSCRLRWTNYLRPDIKRGKFSFEEEETIVQLHRILGNKWSTIASHLPGRTDNEIKNYWNTHIRKRLARIESYPLNNNTSHLDFSSLLRQISSCNPSALIITLCRLLDLQPLLKRELMMNVLATDLISPSQNSDPSSNVDGQYYLNSQQFTDQPLVSQQDLDDQLQNGQVHNYTTRVARPDDEILFQGEDTNLWNGMLSQIEDVDKLMKDQGITSNSNIHIQSYSLPQSSTESFSCLGGFTDNQIACHNLPYAATATDSNNMNSPTSTYCINNNSSEIESCSKFLEFQIPDVCHLADYL